MKKLLKYIIGISIGMLFASSFFSASAARFYLSPSNTELVRGCERGINIMIDSEGEEVGSADMFLRYDPTQIEIIDQNSMVSGVQIKPGNVFEIYASNRANASTGIISLMGLNLTTNYRTQASADVYATIYIKPKSGVTSTQLTFNYTSGNTTDTNISDPSGARDLLTSVGNATYSIKDLGSCDDDIDSPYVTNQNPIPNSRDIPLNTNINFDLLDDDSGVDLDTVVVNVNGVDYYNGSSGFSYTGDSKRYTITVTPTSDFKAGKAVIIQVNAKDGRGNEMPTHIFKFNKPAVCGDYKVDVAFDEECEPPNSPGCNADCKRISCTATSVEDAVCGNNIVEFNEQCEPPGRSGCDSDCKVVGTQVTKKGLSIEEEQQAGQMSEDTDNEGLPDDIEAFYGTDPGNPDTDGDSYTDYEEIMVYGSDPLDPEPFEISTRIIQPDEGFIFSVGTDIFVKGVSYPDKNVKVYAVSEETGSEIFLGDSEVDASNLFSIESETDLIPGVYNLIARALEDDDEVIDTSEPITFVIDPLRKIDPPVIETIDEQPFIQGEIIQTDDPTPLVTGYAPAGSHVSMVFRSVLWSSTIIADSQTGFFAIYAPAPLEVGMHSVTALAISEDGIVSDKVEAEFEVVEELVGEEKEVSWNYVLILIFIVPLLIGIFYLYSYITGRKKMTMDDLKEESLSCMECKHGKCEIHNEDSKKPKK